MPGLPLSWVDDVPQEECDHETLNHPYADAVCWVCGAPKPDDDDD
jgi:hypothetical protein